MFYKEFEIIGNALSTVILNSYSTVFTICITCLFDNKFVLNLSIN